MNSPNISVVSKFDFSQLIKKLQDLFQHKYNDAQIEFMFDYCKEMTWEEVDGIVLSLATKCKRPPSIAEFYMETIGIVSDRKNEEARKEREEHTKTVQAERRPEEKRDRRPLTDRLSDLLYGRKNPPPQT